MSNYLFGLQHKKIKRLMAEETGCRRNALNDLKCLACLKLNHEEHEEKLKNKEVRIQKSA